MQIHGLCFMLEQKVNPIPLQNVVIEANIVDMIAEVAIIQTYKIAEKNTIEAFYKFPINEAITVCGFEAEIDGRSKVKGFVREENENVDQYTEEARQGHGAYLIESGSNEVFQCFVGHISIGQTVVIRITYVAELKQDSESEKIRFVLPNFIAMRYGYNDEKIINTDAVVNYLDLKITCQMASIIQHIESPSHKISTEMSIDGNPKIFKITLDEQITYLEKDFILVFKSEDLDQSRAFVEYNPETETNCVMLTLVPKSTLNTTELIFVIDRSGSMSDGPMKRAAQALELLLRSLPEDCYFNIISFGSRYDSLFPKSQLYSETNLSKALNLAQTMTSNYGGTEIFRVLNWAFENSRNDMPTSVFLITDDEVRKIDQYTSENEEKMNDDLRLFALGIVHSVPHNLIESIARAGKGYAQFVTNNERMDKKAIEMLKNAVKSPIKITWTDADASESTEKEGSEVESPPPQLSNIFTDIKIQQAPYFIPPLRNGERFVVYCMLEKSIEPCKVITLNGSMKLDISLDPATLQGSKIHKLAARKLIQDLENGESFLHRHPKNVGKHIINSLTKEYIVNLVRTFNLVSKHTGFIAIDNKVLSRAQIISQKREITHSSVNSESKIEDLFEFLGLQSFDGLFLPTKSFYDFFIKKKLNDFAKLKREIEKEIGEVKEIEQILTTSIAIAYLEVAMFENFKDECKMCHEKAVNALKKIVGEEKEKIILGKAKEWIKFRLNDSVGWVCRITRFMPVAICGLFIIGLLLRRGVKQATFITSLKNPGRG